MSTTAIACTTAYRNKVALAAANGSALPKISHMAFGTGSAPYAVSNTALAAEFLRIPATVSVAGVTLTALATLLGSAVGSRTVQEVGVFAQDGTLVGRRVFAPKAFEPETQMEFELTFQY